MRQTFVINSIKMSLDVYLTRKLYLSYDEGKTYEEKEEDVYNSNITHNLGEMADKSGIYEALWRPHRLKEDYNIPENDYFAEYEFEEKTTTKAKDIIDFLEKGLADLKARPDYFKKFNSPNGWGMYEQFVPFVEEYLNACKEFPEAIVRTCR